MTLPPDQASTTTKTSTNNATMFRTTFHNNVTTPIPSDLNTSLLLALLHDHSYLITMQPIVTRHSIRSRDQASGEITYDIWENIDLLPFGLWKREIQFQAAFTDTDTGVVSTVEAPMGFVSSAEYVIRPAGAKDSEGNDAVDGATAEEGGWVLEEKIESSCNVVFKWFVQGTMVPVRRKMHARILEKVREREVRRSVASAGDGREGNWV